MVEDRALRMVIGRLLTGDRSGDLRKDLFEQAALAQQLQAARRVRRLQELHQLFADALGADGFDLGCVGLQRGEGARFDREIQLGGEAHGAQQAEVVLGEAFGRHADRADDPGAQIGFTLDPVVQLFAHGVVEQAVDGKVAAEGVGHGIAEYDAAWAAAILVIGFSPEGSDLEWLALFDDHYNAELASDRQRAAEQVFDLLRQGGGNNVVVSRRAAEQEVTHAAANPESGEAGLLQAAHDLQRRLLGRRRGLCGLGLHPSPDAGPRMDGDLRFTMYDFRAEPRFGR